MKIIIYLIILFVAYQFLIKPLLANNNQKTFNKKRDGDGVNIDQEPPSERDIKDGEYIDYEEIKDK